MGNAAIALGNEMRRGATFIAGALYLAPAAAQATEVSYGVGFGIKSCAEFGQAYKNEPQAAEVAYVSWAHGLMTGMNLTNDAAKVRNVGAISETRLFRVIANYCDKHPLDLFIGAVVDVYKELPLVSPSNKMR